jgi:amino acid permease
LHARFECINFSPIPQVLSFVGATGSTTICYILPGLLYYKLRETTDSADNKKWDIMKLAAVFLTGFGMVFLVVCLSSLTFKILEGLPDIGGDHFKRSLIM